MVAPTLTELATGVSMESIPSTPKSTLAEQVVSSDMSVVDKLSALCSIERTYQNVIMSLLRNRMAGMTPQSVLDAFNADALVAAGGKISASTDVALALMAFDTLPQISISLGVIDSSNVRTDRIENIGRVSPTMADMAEAVSRTYEANYRSIWAYTAAITGRAEALSDLALWVVITTLGFVRQLREKGRLIAQGNEASTDNTNSESGSAGSTSGSGATGTNNTTGTTSGTDTAGGTGSTDTTGSTTIGTDAAAGSNTASGSPQD